MEALSLKLSSTEKKCKWGEKDQRYVSRMEKNTKHQNRKHAIKNLNSGTNDGSWGRTLQVCGNQTEISYCWTTEISKLCYCCLSGQHCRDATHLCMCSTCFLHTDLTIINKSHIEIASHMMTLGLEQKLVSTKKGQKTTARLLHVWLDLSFGIAFSYHNKLALLYIISYTWPF